MDITLLQRSIDWCKPEKNRLDIERMIAESPKTDLFVLAEMFTTGFCMKPAEVAENIEDSATLQWMKRVAVERQCALAGSVAVEEDGRYYNRFYFVFPDGSVEHYDKRHLFTYGGEHLVYTPGTKRVIVEYKGVRILLQVCYDLRFPVWSRNNNDYDLILYVASWPTSRISVWDVLLRARAIENQCYVVGVNRVGTDLVTGYCGHSAAINAYGKEIIGLGEGETISSFSVDLPALQTFRKNFPVLEDRESFLIEN